MPDELFGKDLGLVHQVVVHGRDVGADRAFWSALADNRALLGEVVEFVKKACTWLDEDDAAVKQWLMLLDVDCPFVERESYIASSSYSRYYDYFRIYHQQLAGVFWKGQRSEKARAVCEEVECYFILCYTLSAVWATLYGPPEHRWNGNPLEGLLVTFRGIVKNNDRTQRGWCLTHEHFLENPAVCLVRSAMEKFGIECFTRRDVEGILAACKAARDLQRRKILDVLHIIAQPATPNQGDKQ